MEPKIFKTYIRTNLANNFIMSSKFFTRTSIFFLKIPNESYRYI